MLIVTVMLAMIFGMVLHITGTKAEEQSNRMMQSIHEDPIHRVQKPGDRRTPYFAVTVTPKGAYVLSSHAFFDHAEDEELLAIARKVHEWGENRGFLREHNLRFSRKTLQEGEQIVFLDVSMEQGMMKELIRTCISISIVSYLLFFVISVVLAQWAIRPVETAWKNQRQFVADASHELKTPLAVIMTNAELMQEDNAASGAKNQFAISILTMARQMRGLVEGLLELSRVDNGNVITTFGKVDFSAVVEDCLLPFEPVFFERGAELDTKIESGIHLRGSESHLRQVTDILLDNAAKYGSASQPVQVTLQRQGRNALLSISTAGEEISRGDLKNIFKRFYRIDKVRSMDGSYGLGLSIAEGIVTDHRGKIWAESKNGINTFFVQLPVISGKK